MAVKIQIKRGTKAGLPALSPGEYGLATDTGELFIGGANGNIQVATLGSDGKIPGGNLDLSGYVPTTRKINNKALSADVTLAAGDVGAVPTSRTVNGKALSSNISLTASDVGAYTKEESAEAAENAIEPVGTIKATVRTDLGDKWLLCNGDTVSREEYPSLSDVISPDISKEWEMKIAWQNSAVPGAYDNEVSCITYGNGYWVAAGTDYDGSNHRACIFYTTDLNSEWTKKILWSHSDNYGNSEINGIIYADGYFVVAAKRSSSSTYYAQIAYATSPDEEWTQKTIWSGRSSNQSLKCLTYANGYWAVGGERYYGNSFYGRIAYSQSLDGEWTGLDIWTHSSTSCPVNCITYAEGKWAVGGQRRVDENYFASIAYSENINGQWITKDLWSYSNSSSVIRCIFYANGQWVVGGRQQQDGSTFLSEIAYSTSLAGEWTQKSIWSGNNSSNAGIDSITYADGSWVLCGRYTDGNKHYGRIAYALFLDGPWEMKDLWGSNNSCNYIKNISFSGQKLFACGAYYDSSWASPYCAELAFIDLSVIRLPLISISGAYAYIKAKK